MTILQPQSQFQPLYILCSSSLQSQYQAPPWWFETINGQNFLKILVQPDEYTYLREGDAPIPVRTFALPQYKVKLKDIGFTINLPEDNLLLRMILEDIVNTSTSPATVVPTTVIDYVKPDAAAIVAAIASGSNPYTIRTGVINVEPGSGSNGVNGNRIGVNGIRFTFKQTSQSLN